MNLFHVHCTTDDDIAAFRDEGNTIDTLSKESIRKFQHIVYDYFEKHGRRFPWRGISDPYKIVVSEVMLQQTQTDRVIDKFNEFITAFPTIQALADAQFSEVLLLWKGLGYNRRARYLHQIAQVIKQDFNGEIPQDPKVLETLPGLGAATSSSICAFAFDLPVVFIETNVRTVFIHMFFRDSDNVHDKEIFPLVETSLDRSHPQRWYSALMDFGVMLKKKHVNPSRRSKHYSRQSPFKGSRREMRGKLLQILLEDPDSTVLDLSLLLNKDEVAIGEVLKDLSKEGLVRETKGLYRV